jgi:hypothetical protein
VAVPAQEEHPAHGRAADEQGHKSRRPVPAPLVLPLGAAVAALVRAGLGRRRKVLSTEKGYVVVGGSGDEGGGEWWWR